MKNFNGKIVLITGGASGIGKIMVRLFLERKAKVVIWDINQESINQTVAELSNKGQIFGYKVDVSSLEQIQESAQKVKSELGIVDVLINNAGIIVGKYFPLATISKFFLFVLKTIEGKIKSAFSSPQIIKVQFAPCQKPLSRKMMKVFLTFIHNPPLLPPQGI